MASSTVASTFTACLSKQAMHSINGCQWSLVDSSVFPFGCSRVELCGGSTLAHACMVAETTMVVALSA